MTDRDKIVALAEVMGWKVRVTTHGSTIADRAVGGGVCLDAEFSSLRRWDPLRDLADAFEVQTHVLAGHKAATYVLRMYDLAVDGNRIVGSGKLCRAMLEATPRQRMDCVLQAYGI